MSAPKIGFIYQAHKQDLAFFNCLKSVRKHYPDEHIYVINDNGNDYRRAAQLFNCKYVHYGESVPPYFNMGINDLKSGAVSTEEATQIINRYIKYLYRMRNAVSYLSDHGCEYFLRLEDDVRCYGRLLHMPDFDIISSYNASTRFDVKANDFLHRIYMEEEVPGKYSFGAGGGALFRCTKFLSYINTMVANQCKLLKFLVARVGIASFTVWDVADGFGFLFMGYRVGRSVEISGSGGIESYHMFTHHEKTDYDKPCDLNQLIERHQNER